jgi:hypothetical protein
MAGITMGAEMRYVPPLRSSVAPPRSVMLEAMVWRGPRGDRSAATAAVIAAVESFAPVGSAPNAAGVMGVLAPGVCPVVMAERLAELRVLAVIGKVDARCVAAKAELAVVAAAVAAAAAAVVVVV